MSAPLLDDTRFALCLPYVRRFRNEWVGDPDRILCHAILLAVGTVAGFRLIVRPPTPWALPGVQLLYMISRQKKGTF